MISPILWYITISILGWASFPIVFRLLPALKDRGYTSTRAFGILLWSFLFWLLASLGILKNETGGLLFAFAIILGFSVWVLRGIDKNELREWLTSQIRLIVSVEFLFLIAFAFWTLVRAANPEAVGTEKPMELAFINAILRSPTFPPHDPWLSGYAISYYYFGYVMIAMLAKITSTSGGVAFNLGVSLVFALSALGSYGLIYNLLNKFYEAQRQATKPRFGFASLLGPLFVLIVSNLEGFLEILHSRGIFWIRSASGELVSPFWRFLDIKDLTIPPQEPFTWFPDRFWWWWRASRILQDYDLAGNVKEIIDEFPFFSYLLADLHPHVLAMPFAFLAMTMALNAFLGGTKESNGRIPLPMDYFSFFTTSIVLGGMSFLNTWDFPLYVGLFAAAYAIGKITHEYLNLNQALRVFIWVGLALGICGGLLYIPFYLGFSSQLGGILPNLIYPARLVHLWVMFAPLLLPIFIFLLYLSRYTLDARMLKKGLIIALGSMIALWVFSLLLGLAIVLIPDIGEIYQSSLSSAGMVELFQEAIWRRALNSDGWLSLLILLTMVLGLIFSLDRKSSTRSSLMPTHVFALLIILFGVILIVIPEFIYLRDLFGWRMNTIFKFYFQSWLLLSIAAAYATVILLRNLNRHWGVIYAIVFIGLLLASLIYPILSLYNKTNGFKPMEWTLDSTAHLNRESPEEMSAIEWLKTAHPGVIAEAVPEGGGSYTQYGRVSMLSGLPSVIGWIGHENQWRGNNQIVNPRQGDLEVLYCSRDWNTTKSILDKYNIRYVFIGSLEHLVYSSKIINCPYGLVDLKFIRNLNLVFEQGSTAIFEYNNASNE